MTFIPGSVSSLLSAAVPSKPSARKDGSNYTCPWDVAKVLYPEIKPFIGWGKGEDLFGDAPLLISLLGEHMLSYKPWVMQWAKDALAKMRTEKVGHSIWAGDLDFHLELLLDVEGHAIFHLRNSCTCSPNDNWIIIYKYSEHEEVVHVRAAWNVRGKEEKKSVFDDGKPTFRYFKKTNFATPYEDGRDPGYVLTHKVYKGALAGLSSMEESADRFGHYFHDWKHCLYNMQAISSIFDDEPENPRVPEKPKVKKAPAKKAKKAKVVKVAPKKELPKPSKPAKRESTCGKFGGPKIAYTSNGKLEELYGHGCRTTEEAEDYVNTLFPNTSFHVVYDDMVAPKA